MADANAENKEKDSGLWRDLTAYWFLGLCNNYGYVVMLSAAHDIIDEFEKGTRPPTEGAKGRECHLLSTGAILLADVLPSLMLKIVLPFCPFWVNIRIALAVLFSASGFIFVAFANAKWMAIFGVVVTSASSGIGELTFLAYSSNFNRNVISTWSSGTGGAGIIGSFSYASLRGLHVSPRNTMLIMLIVPLIEALSFWVLLRKPSSLPMVVATKEVISDEEPLVGFKEKILYIKNLVKYMVPLTMVYIFEYFINQGLYELVYFHNIFIDHPAQYRWYQVDYQVGVFISRSSVNIIQFKRIWLMSVFQLINVLYFLFEVFYFLTPSIWIIFLIIFWEGLLGGAAYVNTFYRMYKDISPARRLFAISVVVQSDSWGVALAGLISLPAHNAICALPAVMRKAVW